jgi:Mur ligase middle domain
VTTVNAVIGDRVLDTGLHTTTPDAPDVRRYLAEMVSAGLEIAILETTSHGMAQHRVAAYDYDPLYRLISATLRVPSGQAYSTGEVYTYTYDEVGNRLAMGINGQVITYTYDQANRLTSAGGVEYDWDDNPTPRCCGTARQPAGRRRADLHL